MSVQRLERGLRPEFIPARWVRHLLHHRTARLIKGAFFRKGVIATNVPSPLAE